jgi:hypothetical protein
MRRVEGILTCTWVCRTLVPFLIQSNFGAQSRVGRRLLCYLFKRKAILQYHHIAMSQYHSTFSFCACLLLPAVVN